MYGGGAPASQQQPQQYMQPSYGGYQQQQPAQPQATQQWPQQVHLPTAFTNRIFIQLAQNCLFSHTVGFLHFVLT